MIFNNLLSCKKNWPAFFIEKSAVHQSTLHIHQEINARGYICKKSMRYPRISYRVRNDVSQ